MRPKPMTTKAPAERLLKVIRREALGMPLSKLVKQWRRDIPRAHWIPDFDPLDGGVKAKILFLMEKPGPGKNKQGVRLVSRDNDDPTAKNIKLLMKKANIKRKETILWNAIAAWNGKTKISANEMNQAGRRITELLQTLKKLRAIVLVGIKAQEVFAKLQPNLYMKNIKVFNSYHPSLQVRNKYPEKWNAIPRQWSKAAKYARRF